MEEEIRVERNNVRKMKDSIEQVEESSPPPHHYHPSTLINTNSYKGLMS